jgi:hypothetical protein
MRAPELATIDPEVSVGGSHKSSTLKLDFGERTPSWVEGDHALDRLEVATRLTDHLTSVTLIDLNHEERAT